MKRCESKRKKNYDVQNRVQTYPVSPPYFNNDRPRSSSSAGPKSLCPWSGGLSREDSKGGTRDRNEVKGSLLSNRQGRR